MGNNYFFIDGSALISDIRQYQGNNLACKGAKFNLVLFARDFQYSRELSKFHQQTYQRIVFYFVKNDQRIKDCFDLPDYLKPNIVEDIEIKYCGAKIPIYRKAARWLTNNNAPEYVTNSLYKSEKAVDTQICCDALILLSVNRIDRLFLYTNDYDFQPLCQAFKSMGANINLIKLSPLKVNKELVTEFDGFFAFKDEQIYKFFGKNKEK